MARHSPKPSRPKRIVRTIRRSNYYLKMMLIALFIFLLGAVSAYRFMERRPVHNPRTDLPANQISLSNAVVVTPTPSPTDQLTVVKDEFTVQAKGPAVPAHIYTVQPGDSLWTIALQVSKDPYQWVKIYQLNQTKIGQNPDHIEPGMVFTLGS